MSRLTETVLRQKVSTGLATVKRVLSTERNPQLADGVHHKYADKYLLTEFIGNGACASVAGTLDLLGLEPNKLLELRGWAQDRAVTLRYKRHHTCTFDKKETKQVDSATKNVTEVSGIFSAKVTNKTVTTVTEYLWEYKTGYEISAYKGNDPEAKVVLLKRDGAKTKLRTSTDSTPYPAKAPDVMETNVTDFLKLFTDKGQSAFTIDRSSPTCHTPRRNEDVDKALDVLGSLGRWCAAVKDAFLTMMDVQQKHGMNLKDLQKESIFTPVLPLLEEGAPKAGDGSEGKVILRKNDGEGAGSAVVLPAKDLEAFLEEERRAVTAQLGEVDAVYPEGSALVTRAEARAVVLLEHCRNATVLFAEGVAFVEEMLRRQLVAAVGKEVTAQDFAAYMKFHNRKLLKEEYQGRGFCLAVRRPDHYPEGTVSIEETEPVVTLSRSIEPAEMPKISFALNAAADVTFSGTTHVHSYIRHRFSSDRAPGAHLIARARQFSGFVLLLGRIGGASVFLPEHAMVVTNQDDFNIPLDLEEIPTAKEFKDAIESLSPEQQRFAKAYRSMQLESTLFAICIVQIKPQLERVLNLPEDSLTKEIKLTQQLLELFIEYHIPPDLLSFQCDPLEDPDDIPGTKKLEVVKGHVENMFSVIKQAKEEEIEEEKRKHAMLPPAPPGGPPVVMAGGLPHPQMAFARGGPPPPPGAPQMMMACSNMMPLPAPSQPAAAPPPPQQQQQQQEQLQQQQSHPESQQPQQPKETCSVDTKRPDGLVDVSKFPQALEKRFEAFGEDTCLRPTIIKPGRSWTKKHKKKLLGDMQVSILHATDQKTEKTKAFDLLDALTRSGVLHIPDAALHVVVGATHCFDKTLMDTVVQDNVNPIEPVERSMLIVLSTLHSKPCTELLKQEEIDRVTTCSPKLIAN